MSAEERAKEWLGEYEQTAAYRQQGWSDTVITAYLAGREGMKEEAVDIAEIRAVNQDCGARHMDFYVYAKEVGLSISAAIKAL